MIKTAAAVHLLAIAFAATALPAATIEELAWIAGHWTSHGESGSSEELWLPAAGGLMLGLHRDVRANGRSFFEYLRIEDRDGTIAYVAQPGGRPPTVFPLVAVEGAKATFENPDHDFPQRIVYWLEGGRLCARVEGTINGKPAAEQWCWDRK